MNIRKRNQLEFSICLQTIFYLKIKLKSYFEKNSIEYQMGLKNEKRISD